MSEEEFFNRAINRICKDYDYNFANEFKLLFLKKDKEVERLNNIINELEKYINEQIERSDYTRLDTFDEVYDYLQELKGSDKE